MSPKIEIFKKIKQHSNDLKNYGVRKVGLFGSSARSGQHPKSDIDILVEFNKGDKTFDNYMDLKFFLEKLFHSKIDLVIKDVLKAQIKNKVLSEIKYA